MKVVVGEVVNILVLRLGCCCYFSDISLEGNRAKPIKEYISLR